MKKIKPKVNNQEIRKFLLEKLDFSWNIYCQRLLECKEKFSEASVHDLRVSIRRFSSLIQIINSIIPSPYSIEIKSILKKQLKMFGKLRDTQVQLLAVQKLRRRFPELSAFIYHLLFIEPLLIKKIGEKIQLLQIDELEGQVFFLKMDMKGSKYIDNISFKKLIEVVEDTFGRVLNAKNNVVPDNPETIHKVRIAFKNFRYTMEHLQKLIGVTEENLRKIKTFQTLMGNIQDFQVLYKDLSEFSIKQNQMAAHSFLHILGELGQRNTKLIDRFMKKSYKIDLLWKGEKMESKIKIVIQHFEGCPNGPKMIENVKLAISEFKDKIDYQEILVETNELAEKLKFRGSPTLLINGKDIEGMPEPELPGLTCRFYKSGVPLVEEIKEKIMRFS
jgi:CHAD domain-containing protein